MTADLYDSPAAEHTTPGAPIIDENNPWPGLPPYDEASRAFFHGRNREASELFRLIQLTPLTSLYGKSGLGKSSLLQAGLFPLLREAHYLPVYLRIDFTEQAAYPPLEQIAQGLQQEISRQLAEAPTRAPGQDLWQYLHREDFAVWSRDVFQLTPLIVLDQFEELFAGSGSNAGRIQTVLDELGDLLGNHIPASYASESTDRSRTAGLDLLSQRYSVLLAFREDFLPEMRCWQCKLPSLLRSYLRLEPLSYRQAIEAVELAGQAVMAPGAARIFVDFVGKQDSATVVAEPEIEPVLLSLFGYQLNLRRKPGEKIDQELIQSAGQDILDGFFRQALEGMPDNVHRFIETCLIQGDQYRSSYPVDQALREGVLTQEQLNTLKERRLLRIDQQQGTNRIELIHDRLVSVVSKDRDKRLRQEELQRLQEEERLKLQQAAEQEKLIAAERLAEEQLARANAEAEARQQAEQLAEEQRARASAETESRQQIEQSRIRLVWMRNGLIVLLVVAVTLAARAWYLGKDAKQQMWDATALRLTAESQVMLAGSQAGGAVLGLLKLLAAHRLIPHSETDAAMGATVFDSMRLMKVFGSEFSSRTVAFSPDGSRLVSGSDDGKVLFWDAKSCQLIGKTQEHPGVTSVAFSPDGSRLASGGKDEMLRIWDGHNGRSLMPPLQSPNGAIWSVAFSSDGKRIVSGNDDGTLGLWDAKSGEFLSSLEGHTKPVLSVACSRDGKHLASGSADLTLRLWDAKSGKLLKSLTRHEGPILSVAFSRDGTRLVSGSTDTTLKLWDPNNNGEFLRSLGKHRGKVRSVAFSPDGKKLVSSSDDGTLRFWDVENGQQIGSTLRGHDGQLLGVAFSPDGTRLISSSNYGTLGLWDAGEPVRSLQGNNGEVLSVSYSPDGTRLVSGSIDGRLELWDSASGRQVGAPLQGHNSELLSVAFSPDSTRLVSGSKDGMLALWDGKSGKLLGEPLKAHDGQVWSVAFSRDGKRIVSGSNDRTLRLREADGSGQPVISMTGHTQPVTTVAFSPDGTRIVSGSGDTTLRLWNATTGQQLGAPLQGHMAAVLCAVFSPDGKRLVSSSIDETLRFWDAESGQQLGAPLQGHKGAVSTAAFSPDGKRLVSSSDDGALRFWDARSGQQLGAPALGNRVEVRSVAFNPDGTHIAAGCADGNVRFWPAPKAWPDELCRKLTRNMSRQEWRDFVSPDIPYTVQCPGLPIPDDSASRKPKS